MMLPSNTHTRGHTQSHMYLHAEVCKREGKRVREREVHPCDKARLELGRRPLLVETFLLAYGMK